MATDEEAAKPARTPKGAAEAILRRRERAKGKHPRSHATHEYWDLLRRLGPSVCEALLSAQAELEAAGLRLANASDATMSDVTLEPCPVCGGPTALHENDWCDPPEWSVICSAGTVHCGIILSSDPDKATAIAKANRRASAADAEKVVEALRAIADHLQDGDETGAYAISNAALSVWDSKHKREG